MLMFGLLTFKLVICVNALPQSVHTYGRRFVWILSWFLRLAACVNPARFIDCYSKTPNFHLWRRADQNFARLNQFIANLSDSVHTDICVQRCGSAYASAMMISGQMFLSILYKSLLHHTTIHSAAKRKKNQMDCNSIYIDPA